MRSDIDMEYYSCCLSELAEVLVILACNDREVALVHVAWMYAERYGLC